MPTETQLKFCVATDRLSAVRRAVATKTAKCISSTVVYVDTQEEHLAKKGLTFCLSSEGLSTQKTWKQTLRERSPDGSAVLEHSVVVLGHHRPVLDPSRHAESEVGGRLSQILAEAEDSTLIERYTTESVRTSRVLRKGGTLIELILEEGQICAETQLVAVSEMRFNLILGVAKILLEVVESWLERFDLVLDTRSWQERGMWLARGQTGIPPSRGRRLVMPEHISPAQTLAVMLKNTLAQIMPNASEISVNQSKPEHLHQLRVGMRRLRTVLRLYGSLAPLVEASQELALAKLFQKLGTARDYDAMAESLWPLLRAAQAPLVETPAPVHTQEETSTVAVLCAKETQRLWIGFLVTCHAEASAQQLPPLRKLLVAPLRRLHRKIRQDAAQFSALDDEARHRLRRRIKRLRYAWELVGSLWPSKAVGKYLRHLQNAQTPLGELMDTTVALEIYRNLAQQEPRAWFAVGWLSARREALLIPCEESLLKVASSPRFWSRH